MGGLEVLTSRSIGRESDLILMPGEVIRLTSDATSFMREPVRRS